MGLSKGSDMALLRVYGCANFFGVIHREEKSCDLLDLSFRKAPCGVPRDDSKAP